METGKTNSIIYVIVVMLLASAQFVSGQVTAGSIPPGFSIVYNVVDLRIADLIRDTAAHVDLDGNGTYDVGLLLRNGAPAVDDPHEAKLDMISDSFSICISTDQSQYTYLYNYGEAICTSADQAWGDASQYIAGCYGAKDCNTPLVVATDKYIGYRKNSTGETGWMKVSYDLWSGVTPDSLTFTLSELLVPYLQTGTQAATHTWDVHLIPNPTFDGRCFIQSSEPIVSIAIFDPQGQLMHHDSSGSHAISLPDQPGLFFISIQYKKGRTVMSKVIRL